MRPNAYWLAAVLASAGCTGLASAAPCYVIYDRDDAVIYRDYTPPFDMSDDKSPERLMMRQTGQHLLVAEFDNCNPVGYISPTTGATAASVDEIVNGVQPAIGTQIANTGGTVQSGTRPGAKPVATPRPAAAAAPAAAPAKKTSSY
ncbi:MAG TPA: hypothetical protein VMN56_12830 [Casimicrobiaceae bacterium]|nr:hypothetical protein [Casimicrobiaceae bacterium]